MKPKYGLMRGREFAMKDLYTFDKNLKNAEETYHLVNQSYENILRQIGIKYIKGTKVLQSLAKKPFYRCLIFLQPLGTLESSEDQCPMNTII